ncbi:photosynthetic complex assembly protein PuhC [uncultured Enterovirga sp.]|uniref:photosynthetic complex assembly protein PuhC n=1 Tax=uncultured Enterovirga sp. TaxID=2026352 RepID=UPI0035CB20D0
MATTFQPDSFPKGPLIGAAGVVAIALVAAMTPRLTGVGKVTVAPGIPVAQHELRFEDGPDGSAVVRDAGDGRIVVVLAPQTNHFVRGTVRGLVRERKREGIGAEPPFRLSRLADGRLTLEDSATRRRINLDAFGRSNVGAFSAIMEAADKSK